MDAQKVRFQQTSKSKKAPPENHYSGPEPDRSVKQEIRLEQMKEDWINNGQIKQHSNRKWRQIKQKLLDDTQTQAQRTEKVCFHQIKSRDIQTNGVQSIAKVHRSWSEANQHNEREREREKQKRREDYAEDGIFGSANNVIEDGTASLRIHWRWRKRKTVMWEKRNQSRRQTLGGVMGMGVPSCC